MVPENEKNHMRECGFFRLETRDFLSIDMTEKIEIILVKEGKNI